MLVDFGLAQEYIAEKKSSNIKLANSEVVKRKRSDEVKYQLLYKNSINNIYIYLLLLILLLLIYI